jgi:hypothetical protein
MRDGIFSLPEGCLDNVKQLGKITVVVPCTVFYTKIYFIVQNATQVFKNTLNAVVKTGSWLSLKMNDLYFIH